MTTQDSHNPSKSKSSATKAKETVDVVAQQAKTAAQDVAENAASTAKNHAEAAKSSVADEMSGVASALRTAAEEMRSGSPQERTFGQIAEGLADASDSMRNKDLGEMVQQANAFARKNPLVFLGGAALIGFAATRFAKASSAPSQSASLHVPASKQEGDFS